MTNVKLGNAEISISVILIAIGALVALISLFMGYVNMEFLSYPDWEKITLSGTDVISRTIDGMEGGFQKDSWSFVHWAPLFTVIFAFIGLILAIIPMFAKLPVKKKVYNIIVAAVLVISVIFAIVFVAIGAGAGLFTGEAAEGIKFAIENEYAKMSLGAGAIVGIIGAIIALVGAGIAVKESL